MNYRMCLAGVPLLCILFLCTAARAQNAAPDIKTTDLEYQVAALTTLDELDVSIDQLQKLQKLAAGSAAPAPADPAEITSAEYRTALRTLRDALIGGDGEKIDDAHDKVDELRDSKGLEPKLEVPLTEAARIRANAALKLISSSQIAGYIAQHADEVPDAADTISDALDQCRDGTDQEFAALRDEAAQQVGLLADGMDVTAAKATGQKVADLLNRARKMTQKQFNAQRDALDRAAAQITNNIDSFEALHHWMAREMADLLSNPRINEVLAARIKADSV